jgi:predicted PurR-regulated permease PerM
MYYGDKIKMGIIVGMSQCMVDVSKSDFILMIGRQLLFLCMILFVLCFGSLPITPNFSQFVPMIETKVSNSSNNAPSTVSASTISKASTEVSTSSLRKSNVSSTATTLSNNLDLKVTSGIIGFGISCIIVVLIAFFSKKCDKRFNKIKGGKDRNASTRRN